MGGGVTYALEASANEVDTHKEWKPEGNVIAQGEDGVPWELYENGYLLFKPEPGKDTLSNNGSMSWKNDYTEQIKAIGFDKEIYFPEYSANLFQRIPNLEYFDGHNVNTSLVKNIAGLFSYNFNLKKIMNISDWNTSNVENMEGLFFENKQLERLDLSNWNVLKVKKITFMFAATDNIKEINVLNWDTSNIDFSKQYDVFNSSGVEELNLSKWIIKSPNNSYNHSFLNNMKNIKRIILPQNSIIPLSESITNNELDGYSLKWYKEGTNPFKSSYELYNLEKIWTPEMSGTWLRATNDFKIDFDSKTEEVIEPIIFRAVKKTDANRKAPLPIPKIKKSGYKFVGWVPPHSASEDISNDAYIKTGKEISVSELGEPETLLVAKWVKEEDNRYRSNIIRDVNGKDLTDDELPNYTNPESTPTSTTDNGELVYIVHKIVTKYKGNDTLELNKQVVEKDGKTDGVKLIQVGTKPTVTTIERDNKQIKQTTTYIVNENTGKLTPNLTEEIIGNVQLTTSNGTEAPLTFGLPEYTNPISTNTPIDENGNLILPPTVDKLEYTGTLSTNTSVDKDSNLILPPIVDIPEYKDDIVNKPQKDTKEKLQPKESNKQEPIETTHKSDKHQDVIQNIVNITEVDNNNVAQKQVLPKTNAFYSTPYVLGLLLSSIGLKHNKKD